LKKKRKAKQKKEKQRKGKKEMKKMTTKGKEPKILTNTCRPRHLSQLVRRQVLRVFAKK